MGLFTLDNGLMVTSMVKASKLMMKVLSILDNGVQEKEMDVGRSSIKETYFLMEFSAKV